MTTEPTEAEKAFEAWKATEFGDASQGRGFIYGFAAGVEQGRAAMREEAAKRADDEAAVCSKKRVVRGDMERNYFGGGLKASETIAAAIRSLK